MSTRLLEWVPTTELCSSPQQRGATENMNTNDRFYAMTLRSTRKNRGQHAWKTVVRCLQNCGPNIRSMLNHYYDHVQSGWFAWCHTLSTASVALQPWPNNTKSVLKIPLDVEPHKNFKVQTDWVAKTMDLCIRTHAPMQWIKWIVKAQSFVWERKTSRICGELGPTSSGKKDELIVFDFEPIAMQKRKNIIGTTCTLGCTPDCAFDARRHKAQGPRPMAADRSLKRTKIPFVVR